MASLYRDWRILASLLAAACLIVGAYMLAVGASRPPIAEAATETSLLEALAMRDSTGDGLPDWEKALYGIPLNATTTDYFGLGMTDGEAVAKGLIVPKASGPTLTPSTPSSKSIRVGSMDAPATGSLTDLFAKQFFTTFVNAEQKAGGSLTGDQISALADQALAQLAGSVSPAPDFKTAADIKVGGSGAEAMRTYAASAEAILTANNPRVSKNQLEYLEDYLNTGDAKDLDHLSAISTSYQNTAAGLAALAVPSEIAVAHLALVNSLARIGWQVADFSRVNSDPLSTMLALQEHSQTAMAVSGSFNAISVQFAGAGISIPSGTAGATFLTLARSLGQLSVSNTP